MRVAAILATVLLCAAACVEDVDLGEFGQQTAAAGSGGVGGLLTNVAAAADGAGSGGLAGGSCEVATCAGKIYQCGDCLDNDADGVVDSADTHCLGPCDNTEESFFGGIPGQNNAPCRQDCYFDSDSGSGNDDCYWSHRCDPLSLADDYPPSGDTQCAYDPAANVMGSSASCAELADEQSSLCQSSCSPYVPNGCDCFGCCELPAGSGQHVWLGSNNDGAGSCSEETLDDPTACRPCTPVGACYNPCDDCELCAGRTEPAPACDAPDDSPCGDDYQACGRQDQAPCAAGTYCITGCCVTVPR